MSDKTIFEIMAELDIARARAEEFAFECDGEIPDYLSEILDNIEGEREEKIEKTASFYKGLGYEIKNIDEEIKKLQSLKKVRKNEQERVKEYLQFAVEQGEKIKTAKVQIGWRKSASVVVDIEPSELPAEFQKVKIDADKTALKKAIKDGSVDDSIAHIEEKLSIQIK